MDDTVIVGPEGDQWTVHRAEHIYDLARGAARPLTVQAVQPTGPASRKIALAPARTALVIVDMQNFFLDPQCIHHPTGLAAVSPLLRMIQDCRAVGVQILWLNWGLTDADLQSMPAAILNGFSRGSTVQDRGLGVDLGHGRGRMLMAGQWNSDVYAGGPDGQPDPVGGLAAQVRPDLGDLLVPKNRMSGLWSPTGVALWRVLQEDVPHIRTLLFAGVNTDQCVLGTLVDAYNGGWDCLAVADCCATTTPGGQAVSLWNVANNYGFVIDSTTWSAGVEAFQAGSLM